VGLQLVPPAPPPGVWYMPCITAAASLSPMLAVRPREYSHRIEAGVGPSSPLLPPPFCPF